MRLLGGPCGCIIASRLARADPNLSVVLLDSGVTNRDNPLVSRPGLFLANLTPDSKTVKWMIGKGTDLVAGRNIPLPIGNVFGGGSSVNMVMYSRPSPW
jgi:alcohol oxidase